MKKFCLSFCFLLLFAPSIFAQYKPQEDLGELFVEVQTEPVFPDSKTFVDCIPIDSPREIMARYHEQRNSEGFNLTEFVKQNFIIPKPAPSSVTASYPPLEKHIENLWKELVRKDTATKGSLIALPYSYIVPGGRFNEMYYWDSYFTMLGLQASGKVELIQHMVDNFAWLIQQYGHIPNGTRTYYLSRSQPPYFALMVGILADLKGDEIYGKYLPQLKAEHDFWMIGADKKEKAVLRVVKLDDNVVLNRYWDNDSTPRPEAYKEDVKTATMIDAKPETTYRNLRAAAESGWDFSTRWFRDGLSLETIHTTEIIPVDLNSLLYNLEKTIARAYKIKGDNSNSKVFEQKAEARKKAIMKYCWNNKDGFFMDYDFVKKAPTGVYSLAGMSPLFFSIAEKEQAERVVETISDYFMFPGGLPSTIVLTGEQWDAPNGWAPLQWISYRG